MNTLNESLNRIVDLVLPALREPVSIQGKSVESNLTKLLHLALEALGATTPGWRATIYVLDADARELRRCAWVAEHEPKGISEVDLTKANGVLARVAVRQRAECLSSLERDPPDRLDHSGNGECGSEVKSQLTAPLLCGGRTVGVLSFEAPLVGVFTAAAVDFAMQAAGLAALLVQVGEQEQIRRERDMYRGAILAMTKKDFEQEIDALDEEELMTLLNANGQSLEEVIAELDN